MKYPLFKRNVEEVKNDKKEFLTNKITYQTQINGVEITKHYSLKNISGDALVKLDKQFLEDAKSS